MPRFDMNRWWAKALALQLALMVAMFVAVGSVPRADAGQIYVSEPGTPIDPGLGAGDPDIPTGNLKYGSGMDRYPAVTEGSAMDVAASSESVWVVRLRIVVLGLRAYLLRF